jgi:quercetin dioxygenase-like cupin family protein
MARAGDRFEMPDGSVYIVRRPAAETGGEEVEMEFVLPTGCVPPPPHIHRRQVEEYEVLEGRFDVVIEGEWRTLEPGDTASVPVGALHTFRNRSGATVRVRNWHRPAMRFEEFIERTSRTLRAAGVTRKRDPRVVLYLSKVMLDYDETLYPGRRRERLPMQAFARMAALLPAPPAD